MSSPFDPAAVAQNTSGGELVDMPLQAQSGYAGPPQWGRYYQRPAYPGSFRQGSFTYCVALGIAIGIGATFALPGALAFAAGLVPLALWLVWFVFIDGVRWCFAKAHMAYDVRRYNRRVRAAAKTPRVKRNIKGAIKADYATGKGEVASALKPFKPRHAKEPATVSVSSAPATTPTPSSTPQVDFSFIMQPNLEGNTLYPTVPDAENSKSGVTFGAGIDLGSMSTAQIRALPLPASVTDQLVQYSGVHGVAAQTLLAETRDTFPTLTAPQVAAANAQILGQAVTRAERNYGVNGGVFTDLPPDAQTVLTSVAHQYPSAAKPKGPDDRVGKAPAFWGAVSGNDWDGAVKELRHFGDAYDPRHQLEANLLQRAIDGGNMPRAAAP